MARVRGPYSAAFPVNFTSNGDTTRDAFKKHMDEITRLYGILTEFDKDIANAEGMTGQLTSHINSANPHPNYKPSVSWSNVTDKPGLDDLGGTLTASKVKGALTGATIASGNVTGLEAFVNGKIPASKGDGITESSLNESGSIKFANGLMIQWGISDSPANVANHAITFPKAFPTACYTVMLTAGHNNANWPKYGYDEKYPGLAVLTETVGQSGFTVARGPNVQIPVRIYYLAIGR